MAAASHLHGRIECSDKGIGQPAKSEVVFERAANTYGIGTAAQV
jgi:hypothetical protein